MIDTAVLGYSFFMYKEDTSSYPHHSLPEGYRFVFYKKDDEAHWADIIHSVGFFDSNEEALENFKKDFLGQELLPEDRMLFVVAPNGEYVATCSLWDGIYLGERKQRFHWLAVRDTHAGLGIARALMTRLLDLYNELGFDGFIYIITSGRYYPAVALYLEYGFLPYVGDISPFDPSNVNFKEQNRISLETIEKKLGEYKKKGEK